MNDIDIFFPSYANAGIDIKKVSNKSSKRLTAICPTCSHKWTTCKRDVSNGYRCSACKKRDNSFWNKSYINSFQKQVISEINPYETEQSETKIDFKCETCQKVSRRTVKAISNDLKNNLGFCRICSPIHRIKSGELFLSNYSVAKEYLVNNMETDCFVQTSQKFLFRKSCGHEQLEKPLVFLRNVETQCLLCLNNKSNNEKTFLDSLQKRDNKFGLKCLKCESMTFLTKRRALGHFYLNTDYACKNCVYLNDKSSESIASFIKDKDVIWSESNSRLPEFVSISSAYRANLECRYGHSWNTFTYAINGSCPLCKMSSLESSFKRFLDEYNINYVQYDRDVLGSLELDFYLPDYAMGIEVNGLYWHSLKVNSDKNRHYDKWKIANEKGIKFLVIWEDDWNNNQILMKKTVLKKLGLLNERKIGARKCKIDIVSHTDAIKFLNTNHIQGGKSASNHFGLYYEDDLVAVLSLLKSGKDLIIQRYATSCNVQGGFTKMLSYIVKNEVFERLLTYSDNSISQGKLYDDNGFVLDKILKCDYSYLFKNKRVHKFNFRKSRFVSDENLEFETGLSESQLAELNGLNKIYDYGKKRWVYSL